MTLDDLPKLFATARIEASTSARYVTGAAPHGVCRYCGEALQLFQSHGLDGHARCCVTIQFQRAVYMLYWNTPRLNKTSIAKACGVSITAVSKWIDRVVHERKAPPSEDGGA